MSKLTKQEEKELIKRANDQKAIQEANAKKTQEFEKEFKALCEKYGVVPQLQNQELIQIAQLLPKAVSNQQLMWVVKE